MRTAKRILLPLAGGGGMLFLTGCLTAFWQGLTTGWPSGGGLLNVLTDITREVTVYQP